MKNFFIFHNNLVPTMYSYCFFFSSQTRWVKSRPEFPTPTQRERERERNLSCFLSSSIFEIKFSTKTQKNPTFTILSMYLQCGKGFCLDICFSHVPDTRKDMFRLELFFETRRNACNVSNDHVMPNNLSYSDLGFIK